MSKLNPGVFSSDASHWETPQNFMQSLNVHFDLDACAEVSTSKAVRCFTKQNNALTKKWQGKVWMNPPYGKELPKWLKYAYDQSRQPHCDFVFCLVPARTDTKWFHDIAVKGIIFFLKGRVSFLLDGKEVGSPAFPSMLVIFDKRYTPYMESLDWKEEILDYV